MGKLFLNIFYRGETMYNDTDSINNNAHFSSTINCYNSKTKGVNPSFFGPASMIDFVRDLEKCKTLNISMVGKTRDQIKTEILSTLTGKPYSQMFNVFNSNSSMFEKALFINTLINSYQP